MADEKDAGIDVDKVLEDGVITSCALRNLNEAFEREEHQEKVLNGSLSMVCTYPEGYKERQSLFACLTCWAATGQLAGICFACSENCHDDHEVIQLYTKRTFCCDCGNSKFKQKCKLFEQKSSVNRKNQYNHNFEGKYCVCNNPYPPAENDPLFNVEMYQCIMCEDWFHEEHIEVKNLSGDDYVELLCQSCTTKYPFFLPYHYVCEQESEANNGDDLNATSAAAADPDATINDEETRKLPPVDNSDAENQTECYYEKIKAIMPETASTSRALVFRNIDWRPMLCRCLKCKRIYEDLDCEFLLDEKDSLYQYLLKNAAELEKNQVDPKDQLFNEIASRTNADVAHSAVLEIATLKHDLRSFFSEKAKDGKVITDSDIHSFFDGLKAKRRRLNDPEEEE